MFIAFSNLQIFYTFLDSDQDDESEAINLSDTEEESVNLHPQKRKRQINSHAWKWFDKLNRISAKYRICSKLYKTSCKTSNLHDHISRTHPNLGNSECPESVITNYFQQADSYDANSPRKIEIDKEVMSMIISDMQPFRIVEDVGFRKLFTILDPRHKLPSRTTLQNVLLVEMYEKARDSLQHILKNVNLCSITSDGWTSKANVNYLTVTCHFVVEDKLRSAVLSTSQLFDDTNHSGDNIADSLRAVLNEWGIFGKVSTIVTDNAHSMTKACKILEKCNLPCFAHTLNLVMLDVLAHDLLRDLLLKCKRIISFFKSSAIAYAKFRSVFKKLQKVLFHLLLLLLMLLEKKEVAVKANAENDYQ
ncbi:PREDICTED: zinc finger BED domain-containing protein 1-like [Rhagoletis zephyria]|uniref:zinc finger BED domain-containing protein 1-like n=1 Tax=Rhagoletis zephyria TaxID=28612 RepID=UPI0008119083|nr:PREDICTED: zinc finger BED domain-containing protein 1-like [Rhagoletis zephyria]